MNKIKKISLLFRVIFQCSLVFVLGAQLVGWVYAPGFGNIFNVIPPLYLGYVPNVLTPDIRFIVLISWIMAEGCQLHEEQKLTI